MASVEGEKEENPLLSKAHETIRQQTLVLYNVLKDNKGSERNSSAKSSSDDQSLMHESAANAIANTAKEVDKVEAWVVMYLRECNSTASATTAEKEQSRKDFAAVENPKLSLRVLAIAYKNLLEQVLQCGAAFSWRWQNDADMVNHIQRLFLSKLCHPMVMTSLIFESLRHSDQESSRRLGAAKVAVWILQCCLEDGAVCKQYMHAILTNQQVSLLPSLTVTTDAASMLGSISTYVANSLQQQTPATLLPDKVYEVMAQSIPHCIDDQTVDWATKTSSEDITCGNAVAYLCRMGHTKVLAETWLEERTSSVVPLIIGAAKGIISPYSSSGTNHSETKSQKNDSADEYKQGELLGGQQLCYLFVSHTKTGILFLQLVPESYRERVILHIVRSGKHVLTNAQTDAFTSRYSGTTTSFLNQFRNPLFVAFGASQIVFGLCRYSLSYKGLTASANSNIEILKEDYFDIGGRLSVATEALAEILCKIIPIRHTLSASQNRILSHYLSIPCRSEGETLLFYDSRHTTDGLLIESKVTDPSAVFLLNLWLTVWSDPSFVTATDYRLQASLTRLVLYAMRTLPSKMFGAGSIFTTSVMEGVQSRMSLHDRRTLRLGLRVAQQFSERTALQLRKGKQSRQENSHEAESDEDLTPLQFDDEDLASDSDWSVDSDFTNDWCLSISRNMTSNSSEKGTVLSSDGGGAPAEDSQSDSDDNLEPFEIPQADRSAQLGENTDSDMHMEEAAPNHPVYLHDALSGVKDTNSYQKVSVCIQHLPELIESLASSRRTANELHRNIQYLLRTLLAVDNYFSLEGFEKLRSRSLHKAIVKSPVLAVRYLSKVVFAQEQTMGTRLTVLDHLGEAVMELGGICATPTDQSAEKIDPKKSNLEDLNDTSETVKLRDGSVRPRTKRWGNRSRRKKTSKYTKNSLAEITGEFFFPFIARLRDPSSGVDPLGYDSLFLGHLVKYLAIVVEAAYLSPKIQRMAKELFGLVWMIRFHEDVAVRKAVLLALFSVIKVVSTMGLTHEESFSRSSNQVTIHGATGEQGNFGMQKMIQEIEHPSEGTASGNSTGEVRRVTYDNAALVNGNIGNTFGGDMVESVNWLRATCEHDSDEQCRTLAFKILQYEPLQAVMHEVLGFANE